MKKNIFLIVFYVYLMLIGLIAWHLNNKSLTALWGTMILFYVISSIFMRKYLFLLLFFVSSSMIFPLSINPYTYHVIRTGEIEKEISSGEGTIFFIKFSDNSTVVVLYGDVKQCIGTGYEGKVNCEMVVSMLEDMKGLP